MKNLLILLLPALVLLNGCTGTSTTSGLNFDEYELARITPDMDVIPVTDGVFQRGEEVNLILYNVGKFKQGEDGLHWIDMDLEVIDMNREVIFSATEMLGENGHLLLEKGYAGSPYATFTSTQEMDPGKYKMKLKIYDRVGKGTATVNAGFSLE